MVSALVVVACDIGPSLLENRSGRTMIVRLSELNNERAVRAYLDIPNYPFGDVEMLAVRKYLLPRIRFFHSRSNVRICVLFQSGKRRVAGER